MTEWSALKKLIWLKAAVLSAASAVLKTVTGSIVSITDALAKPAEALSVKLEPQQDLHGYDAPWAPGGNVNLLPDVMPDSKFHGTLSGGKIATATNAWIFAIPCKANTNYTFRQSSTGGVWSIAFSQTAPQLGDTIDFRGNMANRYTFTQNSGSNSYIIINPSNTSAYNTIVTTKQGMVYEGNADLPYSPYANVCPISGWTGANIVASPTQDAEDGTTYTISWQTEAGTVYGGTLDVTSGVLTVTHGNIASYNGESINEPWLSSMDVYSPGATPTTGAQVVYPLATPLTYQLTPTEVQMLLGENYVWSDTNGDLTLTYYADGNADDAEALGILLGGRYTNNHGEDEPSDREALDIILGRTDK